MAHINLQPNEDTASTTEPNSNTKKKFCFKEYLSMR
jgi:hypothetical protein